jgi:hypothetical protein
MRASLLARAGSVAAATGRPSRAAVGWLSSRQARAHRARVAGIRQPGQILSALLGLPA